jgi:hypothetical protein
MPCTIPPWTWPSSRSGLMVRPKSSTEGGNQLLLCPLAHVGRGHRVHGPVISLPMRDERSDADNRVIDVLRELVPDRFAHFHVGLADEIVGGREPAEVGHSLQVPHDDARFHENHLWALAH